MTHNFLSRFALAGALALSLAACQSGGDDGNNLAALDNELAAGGNDAAVTKALGDEIAVDPKIAAQGNGAAGASGAAGAASAAKAKIDGSCELRGQLDYASTWADKLPEAFPVYPGAKVTEAAGKDGANCRLRVVSFSAAKDFQSVLDWYNTQAVRAGYSSEHQLSGADHVLGGTNPDGGAFYLIVTPRDGGSDADLVVNNGR